MNEPSNISTNNDDTLLLSSWPTPSELESEELALLVLYSLVFVVGVTGNVLIILAACQNARQLPVRNNLLINLCVSDLMVTAVSGPVSAAIGVQKSILSLNWSCKSIFYLQSLPVAASTFSLMMLSLDRYAAVKHPRIFSRLCQRHLAAFMICFVWIGAALVSAPIIYVRTIDTAADVEGAALLFSECHEEWGSAIWRLTYLLCHALVVFVVPGVTVAVCHASVGSRLYRTASSLAAAPVVTAAAACELQLRHLHRPRQMVIVAKEQPSKLIPCPAKQEDNSSDEGGLKDLQIAADLACLKEQDAEVERRRQRRNTTMLMALVAVFAACWIPYVTCSISIELLPNDSATRQAALLLVPFFLLLGHAHSAINPVVYWLLNRNFLQKVQRALSLRSCVPLPVKLAQFRIPAMNRNSSTNEAALGAFHPKYTTPRGGGGGHARSVRHGTSPAHLR
ncbi:hypothetical protein B566_EDAN007981 [Ephemera danica]|nr:hypothetical protein B566_EDAN007981 [Ephemera danica]